jgi:hypothetical protein
MRKFFETTQRLIESTSTEKIRYLFDQIDWDQRLVGILGARGTGKTTLMLQYLKLNYGASYQAIYASLDRLFLSNFSLYELAEQFYKNGGVHLFLDEVHKYPNWTVELKGIYDDFPTLKIVFSGSSALLLHKSEADLSRRASIYRLHNLSFREFILFKSGQIIQTVNLDQILHNHILLSQSINQQIRPLVLFQEYLRSGAYPYYFEHPALFYDRVTATVKTIIETDFPAIASFTYSSVVSLQRVLSFIADSVPYKPNISELSRKTGVARDILLKMINLLIRADLLMMLRQDSSPTGYLTKPEKLFLHNTTLAWALSAKGDPDTGSLRETFFMNQVSSTHQLTLPKSGDFLIDNKYTVEIGGANKTKKQIFDVANSFVVQDQIETGYLNTIPLWLFGFLY